MDRLVDKTFEETATEYLLRATWLGENHPMAHSLLRAAQALDYKHTIAMFREYNSLVYRIAQLNTEPKEVGSTRPALMSPMKIA